jgi:hypothetical protein
MENISDAQLGLIEFIFSLSLIVLFISAVLFIYVRIVYGPDPPGISIFAVRYTRFTVARWIGFVIATCTISLPIIDPSMPCLAQIGAFRIIAINPAVIIGIQMEMLFVLYMILVELKLDGAKFAGIISPKVFISYWFQGILAFLLHIPSIVAAFIGLSQSDHPCSNWAVNNAGTFSAIIGFILLVVFGFLIWRKGVTDAYGMRDEYLQLIFGTFIPGIIASLLSDVIGQYYSSLILAISVCSGCITGFGIPAARFMYQAYLVNRHSSSTTTNVEDSVIFEDDKVTSNMTKLESLIMKEEQQNGFMSGLCVYIAHNQHTGTYYASRLLLWLKIREFKGTVEPKALPGHAYLLFLKFLKSPSESPAYVNMPSVIVNKMAETLTEYTTEEGQNKVMHSDFFKEVQDIVEVELLDLLDDYKSSDAYDTLYKRNTFLTVKVV